jgi:hypothetical protein
MVSADGHQAPVGYRWLAPPNLLSQLWLVMENGRASVHFTQALWGSNSILITNVHPKHKTSQEEPLEWGE